MRFLRWRNHIAKIPNEPQPPHVELNTSLWTYVPSATRLSLVARPSAGPFVSCVLVFCFSEAELRAG
jgi:hypothetical protein